MLQRLSPEHATVLQVTNRSFWVSSSVTLVVWSHQLRLSHVTICDFLLQLATFFSWWLSSPAGLHRCNKAIRHNISHQVTSSTSDGCWAARVCCSLSMFMFCTLQWSSQSRWESSHLASDVSVWAGLYNQRREVGTCKMWVICPLLDVCIGVRWLICFTMSTKGIQLASFCKDIYTVMSKVRWVLFLIIWGVSLALSHPWSVISK